MTNSRLELDYVSRAGHRVEALEVLRRRRSHADLVRESGKIVELCLKALLRHAGITVPQIHDVGQMVVKERERLPAGIRRKVKRLAAISRDLRRDREMAFYGSEDLVPSEFYGKEHADRAATGARFVFDQVSAVVLRR